jgi:hypothetical protein
MLVLIQDLMRVRSKKRRTDEVATDTDAKRDERPVDLGPGF